MFLWESVQMIIIPMRISLPFQQMSNLDAFGKRLDIYANITFKLTYMFPSVFTAIIKILKRPDIFIRNRNLWPDQISPGWLDSAGPDLRLRLGGIGIWRVCTLIEISSS